MEEYLDDNIQLLRDKITGYAGRKEVFDIKKLLHYYTIDVLGELAFSKSFGVQAATDNSTAEALVPPVVEHSLLAAVTGSWPSMTMALKSWLPLLPHKGLRALFKGRADCARLASECVQRRMSDLEDTKQGSEVQRKDILTNLILAKHPDTGERLARQDLEAEAFGFM